MPGGNAFKIGRIIQMFTGKGPLKVLDLDEPLFEPTPGGTDAEA
jgi:hypothetical protein